MFNGVEESGRSAIDPFVRNIAENVSAGLEMTQLGWIVQDPRVHRANCTGMPLAARRRGRAGRCRRPSIRCWRSSSRCAPRCSASTGGRPARRRRPRSASAGAGARPRRHRVAAGRAARVAEGDVRRPPAGQRAAELHLCGLPGPQPDGAAAPADRVRHEPSRSARTPGDLDPAPHGAHLVAEPATGARSSGRSR